MRFSYNSNHIQPSSIETNEKTTNPNEYFEFEDEFQNGALEMFTIPDESGSNIIRGVVSFVPPITEGDHIITEEGVGKVVDTTGGVRLGKMSFQTTEDKFDSSWFQLVPVEDDSPATGIKINRDGKKYYQANGTEDPDKNVFRFTDETASKNANLSNLVLSSGTVNETEPAQSTYKEYSYTPEFHPDTLGYNLTLLEYIDTIDIKVTKEDVNSALKIKVPKRDEQNQLVYESDGTTIVYEEKEMQSDTPFPFVLNKLGEEDTKITIMVTAEDKDVTKEYSLVIKRPYGTIRGKIFTEPTTTTTTNYNASVLAYDVVDTTKKIDWNAAIQSTISSRADDVNQKLHSMNEKTKVNTNDDGTFEIKMLPGNYDILIDKPGYLDRIFVNVKLDEDADIDLVSVNATSPDKNENSLSTLNECITLFAGDCNKNGVIEILDSTLMIKNMDSVSSDSNYDENCDLNDSGRVEILDRTALIKNNDKVRKILRFSN